MKLAIETINNYLKQPRSTKQIVDLLGRTEIEVEEIISSNAIDSKIILANVVAVMPHPRADRLKLVDIDTGSEVKRVVCGAPNVKVQMQAALVQPGSILPNGIRISKSKIRGEVSHGMLASGQELGLSDDHTGILNLDHLADPIGTSLCDIIKSADVLDIKTPANRWDYLSGVGVAREIAAYDSSNQKFVEPAVGKYKFENNIEKTIVKAREVCSRFVGLRLKVNNDVKTPSWIVDNLEANGFVSHNPVVDITNYVMLETGQPSHAYDVSKITTPLAVRFAKSGESMITLDSVERKLTSQDVVVCDKNGIIALAGIMGSESSQIDENTREIILEAAIWDKTAVRRTALSQGLRTEASARFERGLPLPLAPLAIARQIDLLIEICQAEIIEGPFDQLYKWPWQQFLGVRLRRAEKILGTELDETKMVKHLRRLGFAAEHFSLTKELRSHLGKPYRLGANFRQDGEAAFDCSYLVDRVYSKIGQSVGHTALGQYHHGQAVSVDSLKLGDVLFIEGKIEHSAVDHYYTTNHDGSKQRHDLKTPLKVGHNGIYMGGGQVIHASQTEYKNGGWIDRKFGGVIISPVEEFIENPGYLGARRYVDSFNHLLAITVPWWRTDIHNEFDIIEELGKIVGYDSIAPRLPGLSPMPLSSHSSLPEQMELRKWLVATGLTEVTTYSFISRTDTLDLNLDQSELLPIANPRSPEQAYVRSNLLSSHLKLWAKQSEALSPIPVIFEISRVFESNGLVNLPTEKVQLGISCIGEDGLTKIQAVLHRLIDSYKKSIKFQPLTKSKVYVARQSAKLIHNNQQLGMIGRVKSTVSRTFGVGKTFSYCQVDLGQWLASKTIRQTIKPLPQYQLVDRDITLEINDDCRWQEIEANIRKSEYVWSVIWLDSFRDKSLEQKSRHTVTFRLILDLGAQPTAEEINTTLNKIVAHIKKALGASANPTIR